MEWWAVYEMTMAKAEPKLTPFSTILIFSISSSFVIGERVTYVDR